FRITMGFLDLFKKNKKKGDKDSKKFKACAWEIDPSSRDPRNRRSVHFGDQFLQNPYAWYQSIGKKYPKGPRSCPDEELYEDDWDASAQVSRNKSMTSDIRPTSSHKVHPVKNDASRYSTFQDASSEEEEPSVRFRNRRESKEPSLTEEDRMMRDSYRQAYYKEKEQREQEKKRNDDMVDLLRQKVRALEMNNDALMAERRNSMRGMSTSMQYVETTQQMQMMSPYYPSSHQGQMMPRTSTPATGRVVPFGAFSPSPYTPSSLPLSHPTPLMGQFPPPITYPTPSRVDTRGSVRGMATPRQLFDAGITADDTFSTRGSPYSAEQSLISQRLRPDNMRAAPNDGAPESLASSPEYAQYDES
ncbi:hypothetical protein PRIPAC_83419, partial [Pristionchus pacificus]